MRGTHLVHLRTVHGVFHARVVAARLGADGIVTELRGAVGGTYPLPGEVAIYVGEEDLDQARDILLADEVESAFADLSLEAGARAPAGGREAGAGAGVRHRWLMAGAMVALLCFSCADLLSSWLFG
jgi:hypothetical protein